MKKRLLTLLSAVLAVFLLAGCGSQEEALCIAVDRCAVYAEAGGSITLPAAAVERGGQTADGAEIKCTVYRDEAVIAEFNGAESNLFTPPEAGIYVAEYSAVLGTEGIEPVQKRVIAEQPPEPLAGIPEITVDRTEAAFASYSDVVLRAAKGRASDGTDISGDIKLTLIDSMSKELFSGDGSIENTVSPLAGGTYIAVYTLENEGMKDAVSYLITVIEGTDATPSIKAPTEDVQLFAGREHRISDAAATDPIEGDISPCVKVHIEDASGNTVFPETPADKINSYKFEKTGIYKVVYTCKNSKGISAPAAGYSVSVLGSTSDGIRLDGVIDETEYASVPAFRTGLGGNTLYYFYRDAAYLYVAAHVEERTLIVSKSENDETALNTSDGIELLIDPSNSTSLTAKGVPCFRVRVSADGRALFYKSAESGTAWQKGGDDMKGSFAVRSEGTFSYAGETKAADESASDLDTGYTVEMRIPWTKLGFPSDPFSDASHKEDCLGIAFGHRDVSNPQHHYAFSAVTSASGTTNNSYYNGMHYISRSEVSTEGLCPAYYSELYLRGSRLGVDPVTYDESLILDGYMEKGFWSDAERIPYGETAMGAHVDAFAKTDKNGLYIGVYIYDTQLVAEPRSFHGNRGIKFNDRLDLRIADASTLSKGSLPKASAGAENITSGKIMFLDPTGACQMHMLQAASARCIAQLPYAYASVAHGTVGYSRDGNLWSDGKFVADTDIYDIDTGWGCELFIPWSSLNMKYPEQGKTAKVGIVVSILDRDADPSTAEIVSSLMAPEGRAKSTLGVPSSYYILETKGE